MVHPPVLLRFSFGLLLACSSATVEAAENRLSAAEDQAGWKLLFDGETTDGWRTYGRSALGPGWSVVDGALRRVGQDAGDIVTRQEFERFELTLDFRVPKGGKSGLLFHVQESQQPAWQSGPEVEICDDAAAGDAPKTGWLYDLYQPVIPTWARQYEREAGRPGPSTVEATRPAGEWNQLYLRVDRQSEVIVNGLHYFYFQPGSEEWNRRVSESRFNQFVDFGKSGRGHICLQDAGTDVAFRNIKIRPLSAENSVPEPVDVVLPLRLVPAFPSIEWVGERDAEDRGIVKKMRPLMLMGANDGTGRVFVATQGGAIYAFQNRPDVVKTQLFLDLRARVTDWSENFEQNEEGLLGLAFHPNFRENGQLFVYYTSKSDPHTSVVSRFRIDAADPDRADPQSEEVLMRLPQPFPNHNGGAIAFGPDGYLYISLGDGGHRNDLLGHAQDLSNWFGSILRIDVNQKDGNLPYAIPRDNPFVERNGAAPEIFAYGFRNLWRLAFDRQTGLLWVADVGQDLWEEINLVHKGGNYGWSMREGMHPFGNRDFQPQDPLIDPIWEYDHQIGKSVTGGLVYRGKLFPELSGHYLYADFVSGRIWGLHYDEESQRVIRNVGIPSDGRLVFAFGEDDQGEVYILTETVDGQGIFRLERTD